MKTRTEQSQSRAETAALITVLMMGAFGLNYAFASSSASTDRVAVAMRAHVKERRCVVAETEGRQPVLYRCDLPTANEYIESQALRAEAVARHP